MPAALPPPTPTQQCVREAAVRYQVPELLLYATMTKEGGAPGVARKNRNGTEDLGRMQINTSHLPLLARFGITRNELLWSDCTNIHVGAWLLRSNYARLGDWTRAIIAYNVGPHTKDRARARVGLRYAHDVITYWHRFYNLVSR